MSLDRDEWLALMRREYLDSLIPAGGGAVRFVVTGAESVPVVARDLAGAAAGSGLIAVGIDTATVKPHMLHTLFFAIAGAIDWLGLARARLEGFVSDAGYRWPLPGERQNLDALAAANHVAPILLRSQINQAITRAVWDDTAMTRDFRGAMITLIESHLVEDRLDAREAVLEWLHGTLRQASRVKPAGIGARITRHNARATLRSLCHWLIASGGRGLLIHLDISRLLRERREVSEGLFYSPAAVMDCYEVLRQMIDDADRMPGLFLAVLSDPALLADERRALDRYTALKMRVWDDVRPESGDNPLSPLVVLR